MKRSEIIDYIKAYAGKFVFGSLASYEDTPTTADLVDEDIPSWLNVNDLISNTSFTPVIYNLAANSETPIIINFLDSTIQIGSDDPIDIGFDLTKYQNNPGVKFEKVIDSTNTKPIGTIEWIENEEWVDDTYTQLMALTIQPDSTTGAPGGFTLDNINIIIKA